MNIHPVLVHFPVAFLTVYALLELVPFKKITKQPYWFYVKFYVLFFGVIGAGAAILAGQAIENNFGPSQLVSLHSKINETASFLFGLLLVAYLVEWITRERKEHMIQRIVGPLWKFFLWIRNLLYPVAVRIAISIIALFLITLGAALGGLIAFGPSLDPFTGFLNSFLLSVHFLP